MIFRPYEASDSAIIATWVDSPRTKGYFSGPLLPHFPVESNDMNEMYEKLRETREFVPYTVTDDDGKPVAHFFLNEKDYGDRMVSRIDVLIVDPAARGQGIGKRIMDFAKIETKRLYGHETLTLDVYRSNVAGIRCYEASGFRFNGRTQERVFDWGTEILCDMEVEI